MKFPLCLFALLTVCFTGCGKGMPPIGDWITFQSPDAPYSVLMPFKPKTVSQNNAGMTINMHTCEVGKDLAVMTCSNDFPAIDLKDKDRCEFILKESMNGAMNNIKGKLGEQKSLMLEGKYPMREFSGTFTDPKVGAGAIRARIVLMPGKLVQLIIVGKSEEITKPQVVKCLESLKTKG